MYGQNKRAYFTTLFVKKKNIYKNLQLVQSLNLTFLIYCAVFESIKTISTWGEEIFTPKIFFETSRSLWVWFMFLNKIFPSKCQLKIMS